jgi:hypothetical protein
VRNGWTRARAVVRSVRDAATIARPFPLSRSRSGFKVRTGLSAATQVVQTLKPDLEADQHSGIKADLIYHQKFRDMATESRAIIHHPPFGRQISHMQWRQTEEQS